MQMKWKDWVFSLSDDAAITVDPPLTGEESDLLGLSIKKWEFIAWCLEEGREIRSTGGSTTCALCARYRWGNPVCDGCPVKRLTDDSFCAGTPISLLDPGDIATTLTPAVAKATLYSLIALKEYLDRKESVK